MYVCVEMVPNQVMGEMVLDGGGQFIPAGIDGFHALSLLLASLVVTVPRKISINIQERNTSTREEEEEVTNTPRGYSA